MSDHAKHWNEAVGYFGIEEGMLIKSWRGVSDEVFFRATHWDKSKPLLSHGTPYDEFFQYLQVEDLENGEHYWLRSYPGWVVVDEV